MLSKNEKTGLIGGILFFALVMILCIIILSNCTPAVGEGSESPVELIWDWDPGTHVPSLNVTHFEMWRVNAVYTKLDCICDSIPVNAVQYDLYYPEEGDTLYVAMISVNPDTCSGLSDNFKIIMRDGRLPFTVNDIREK